MLVANRQTDRCFIIQATTEFSFAFESTISLISVSWICESPHLRQVRVKRGIGELDKSGWPERDDSVADRPVVS